MDKKLIAFVKASLRRTWGRSRQRQQALKQAKVSYGQYKCADCNDVFRRKDIQVDHKVCVGKFISFDLFIERLFVKPSGLAILCKQCHSIKTKSDRKKMSNK